MKNRVSIMVVVLLCLAALALCAHAENTIVQSGS